METIKITEEREWAHIISVFDEIIIYARYLNEESNRSVSKPLPGTEFLHGMLKDKIISNELYQQLKRVTEDPSLKYKIVI